MLLSQMQTHETRRIKSILETNKAHARRLCEMGFLPGTKITVARRAPLNSPIAVRLRGYGIIIGIYDAGLIEVE